MTNWIYGTAGRDILHGTDQADEIWGQGGNDSLFGGAGDDWLLGGSGADTFAGGSGSDGVGYFDSSVGVTVILGVSASYGAAEGDVIAADIENLSGSFHADTLAGDIQENLITGGPGADLIRGNGGDDAVFGDDGWDNVSGGSGNDSVIGGDGDDTIYGEDGDDWLDGSVGADYISGGSGVDTVSYRYNSIAGVTVDLANGTGSGGNAAGDRLVSVEAIDGSDYSDTLIGNVGANTLQGFSGNDVLRGGAGADRLIGGRGIDSASYWGAATAVTVNLANGTGTGGDAQGDSFDGIENINGGKAGDTLIGNGWINILNGFEGDDVLRGGAGADELVGGSGYDISSYWGAINAVTVNLATGTGTGGEAQGDSFDDIEGINGGNAGDTLIGSNGVNLLNGFDGNDSIDGAAGHDLLDGGTGNDQLRGGSAMDQLTGGAGADTFIYITAGESPSSAAGRDLITDFSQAQSDKIDLSLIDANTSAAGNQTFTYIGTGLFTGVAGQLHIWYDAGKTIVSGDVNGDKVADFAIALTGILSPVAADFVL